jgi:hypothetical protein
VSESPAPEPEITVTSRDEMIVASSFFVRFLRTNPDDGVVEVVDRHACDTIEVVRRLPDGRDGESTRIKVRD